MVVKWPTVLIIHKVSVSRLYPQFKTPNFGRQPKEYATQKVARVKRQRKRKGKEKERNSKRVIVNKKNTELSGYSYPPKQFKGYYSILNIYWSMLCQVENSLQCNSVLFQALIISFLTCQHFKVMLLFSRPYLTVFWLALRNVHYWT